MKTQKAEPPAEVEPEEVRSALDRILSSKYFVNAHKKKEFLRVICDFHLTGRAHELNEYILGYEVFARDKSYNPSDDPIVRVLAHEIRKKLENYYGNEGSLDPIRLAIPPGNYRPVFSRHVAGAGETASDNPNVFGIRLAPAPRAESETRSLALLRPRTLWTRILFACLVVALLVLGVLYAQLRRKLASTEIGREAPLIGEVWTPFFKDKKPPLVILSNPPVLRFSNPSDPEPVIKNSIPLSPDTVKAMEDKFVTNPEVSIRGRGVSGDEPEQTKVVIEQGRPPSLILSTNVYTGIGEAIGLHYLTDFFRKAGGGIMLKQSRTLTAEDLKRYNVIMLGGVWVNEWFSKLTKNEDFIFTSRGTIENRGPQSGEEREYIPQFDGRTGALLVDYALITVKPNISDANEVMLLAGEYSQGTEAAAEFVTNNNYLDQLSQRLRQLRVTNGASLYFQALLKVGVENGIPTTIEIVAVHGLKPER